MRPRSVRPFVLTLVLGMQGATHGAARLLAAEIPEVGSKLAGRWTLVTETGDPKTPPPQVPATASSGWGREITLAVEADRVTIERHQFVALDVQPPMLFVYRLGGAESRNAVDMGRGPQEQVARAERRGDTLVITSRHAAGTDLETVVKQTFSIDAEDGLIVETTRTSNGVASTTKARYRRQPPPGSSPGDDRRGS